MRLIKSIGLVALGVAIGAFSTGIATAAKPSQAVVRQLSFTAVGLGEGSQRANGAGFIRDPQGVGCWLLVNSGGPTNTVALAVAPADSCR